MLERMGIVLALELGEQLAPLLTIVLAGWLIIAEDEIFHSNVYTGEPDGMNVMRCCSAFGR